MSLYVCITKAVKRWFKTFKMKNQKTKQFSVKVAQVVEQEKKRIKASTDKHTEEFENIEFNKFDNENTYSGELKNKIFFTYSNHYRGNLGTWMSVGELKGPHVNMDDRGYVKGVATDLDGYVKLRSANMLSHNLGTICNIYFPKFRNSKNKDKHVHECQSHVNIAIAELNEFVEFQKKYLNETLRTMTGCSLLRYLGNI